MKSKMSKEKIFKIEKYICMKGDDYLDKRREDLKDVLNSIENIRDSSNLEKIKRIGYRIKGSAGLYGFDKLGDIGMKLEDSVQSGDWSALTSTVDEFQTFLNEQK